MGKFQDHQVWQKAKKLTIYIFTVTNYGKFAKDFDLKNKVRSSVLVINRKIAEAEEQGDDKLAIRHFNKAKKSIIEVLSQSIIANEMGYINDEIFNRIEEECLLISGMLSQLIEARKKLS